jgi:hypothetical protein
VIQRTSVPAPDRDVEGSPATPELPPGRRCTPGAPARGVSHPLPLRGVPRRWHRRCPADRHRQRWSDDRRIPPPGAPCTAVLGDPRPAPDAFSAGTRRLGRGCSRRTAPPHHFVVCSVAASCRCPRRCGYHQTFAAGSAGLDDPCDDWQEPADAAYGELRRPSGLAPAVRQGAVNLYASADDRRAGNEGICG